MGQRSQIESRSADHQWYLTAPVQLPDRCDGQSGVACGVAEFARRKHADQVMWHALPLYRIRFSGQNVEPTVNLISIGSDDLSIQVLGNPNGQLAFAGGGGTCEDQEMQRSHWQKKPAFSGSESGFYSFIRREESGGALHIWSLCATYHEFAS